MSDDTNAMTADYLRGLAEEADGFRGKKLSLVWQKDGLGGKKLVVNYEPTDEDEIVVKTPIEGYAFREMKRVTLYAQDGSFFDVDGNAYPTYKTVDSIFWTQSAADKFLIPYYSAFSNEDEMKLLRQACTNQIPDKDIYAIIHRYPTDYDYYAKDDGDPPPGGPGGPIQTLLVLWAPTGTHDLRLTSLREYTGSNDGARRPKERVTSARAVKGARKTKRR